MKRSSEYAWDSKTGYKHTLMNEDVKFEFSKDVKKYPWEITARDRDRDLVNITTISRSSKSERKGRGQLDNISARSPEEKQFMLDMLTFTREKGHSPKGTMFFSRVCGGRSKKLTRGMVSAALKKMAVEFELPPQHFSSHCARIGGATELIHQGHSDEVQRRIGGWRSKVSLRYPERTLATGGVLPHSTKQKRMNAADVRRMQL